MRQILMNVFLAAALLLAPAAEAVDSPSDEAVASAVSYLLSCQNQDGGFGAALESDSKSLDEALALFERGQALAAYCTALLEKADLKIRQLSGDTLTDFNPTS